MIETASADDVWREVDQLRPLSYFETELPDLPLTRLGDRTFEVLAYSLTKAKIDEGKSRFTRTTLLRIGADKGRDVLLLQGEEVTGVIQCKRYEKALPLPSVLKEIMRFALLGVRQPDLIPQPQGFTYQLWTAGELTGPALEFFDAPQKYIRENHSKLIEAARNARTNVAALRSKDSKEAEAENEAAAALVTGFKFEAAGPVDIKAYLADDDRIRRRFFRGPTDVTPRATANDVARLISDAQKARSVAADKLGSYVGRSALTSEFEQYMASPYRLFAVTGTSGQGKSRWARWVQDNPPAATSVYVLRGEDVGAGDLHVADTIANLLRSRRLGSLSSVDLNQAVLEWIDDASRLIIVDGLDRSASLRLHDWLTRSFEIATRGSTRFAITSRQATWALIPPSIVVDPALIYRPQTDVQADFPAVELGPLTEAEIAETYLAYGLPAPARGARSFRTPGLIALEARIRGSAGHHYGTRLAVLFDSLKDLQRQLNLDAGIGPQQFRQLTERLGDLLIENGRGRINLDIFHRHAPDLVPLLDRVVGAGLASIQGETIRIEPDDLIEVFMALRLDPAGARKLVDQTDGDVAIGAAALAVARLEPAGHDHVRSAIQVLHDGASFNSAALTAAARAVCELKDRDLIREQAAVLLDSWDLNLLLSASPIVRMLDEIDLPPIDRLKLALRLAPKEDVWDWRGKYFFDDDVAMTRSITGFGHAAEHAIADDPQSALHYLIGLFDAAAASHDPIDDYESVESGLLYLAIAAAPNKAAEIGWSRRDSSLWLFDRVTTINPEAAARLLGSVTGSAEDAASAASRLWSLLYEPSSRARNNEALHETLAWAAGNLLPLLTEHALIVRMLVARLLVRPDPIHGRHLEALWDAVDYEVFWHGLKVLPKKKGTLFAQRFSGFNLSASSGSLLELMPARLFAVEEWPGVTQVLRVAAQSGLEKSASLALETLLYQGAADGLLSHLMSLACEFSSSESADVRSPMIYFAGGSSTLRANANTLADREKLLGILVEHEDGDTLGPLVWKLVQSAPIFPSATERLETLCGKHGSDLVDSELAKYRAYEPNGFAVLKAQWLAIPEAQRPYLPSLWAADK